MQDYRSSHLQKGSDYDCLFQMGSYPRLVWQFESDILTKVIKERFGSRAFNNLDGLKMSALYHVGFVPGTDQRMYLPYRVGVGIEQIAAKVKALARLSNDLLYVCERA